VLTLTKIEVARRQLEVASVLFVADGDILAVHTLCGAAEEILGVIAESSGQENVFERMRVEAEARLGRQVTPGELSTLVNASRNALKHAHNLAEDTFQYDPNHATGMLFRALVNFQLVTGTLTSPMEKALDRIRATVQQLAPSNPGFPV
jgi:hypothetical protein